MQYISLAVLLIIATLLLLPKDQYGVESSASTSVQTIAGKNVKSEVIAQKTYKLLFMGDTMLARSIGNGIIKGKDPYVYVTDKLDLYDLRIANIETTIAPTEFAKQATGKMYTFNSPMQSLDVIKKHVDVGVLANNHTVDFGPSATSAMLDAFSQKGIITVGAGKTINEAFTAKLIKVQPTPEDPVLLVGLIAINDIENNYTNAKSNQAGSANFDKVKVAESIAAVKDAGADLVIIITHWGIEYSVTPTPRQKEWARYLIDSGADAVIGGHPHVVQPTEQYKGRTIVYSMGNFIFDGMSGQALKGQMIELGITLNIATETKAKKVIKINKNVSISSTVSIPVKIGNDGLPRLE